MVFFVVRALLKSDSNLARNSQPHIQMSHCSGWRLQAELTAFMILLIFFRLPRQIVGQCGKKIYIHFLSESLQFVLIHLDAV